MIVKWLVDLLSFVVGGVCAGIAALVPDPPGWVASGFSQLGVLYAHAADFGTWIPVGLALTLVSWILICQVAIVGMRLARVGISYATFGGGSVAD